MKPFKNLKEFKEAWGISSGIQKHTVNALKQTKKEVSTRSFERMKKEIIKTYTQSIERINQI